MDCISCGISTVKYTENSYLELPTFQCKKCGLYVTGESESEIVEKTTKTSTTPPEDGVINFRVQISASKNSIPTAPYNFRGLKNVYTNKNGTMYRYYYGRTEKYKTAQKLLKTARRKGYKSAFIVAFKGNVKIKLQDALKAID